MPNRILLMILVGAAVGTTRLPADAGNHAATAVPSLTIVAARIADDGLRLVLNLTNPGRERLAHVGIYVCCEDEHVVYFWQGDSIEVIAHDGRRTTVRLERTEDEADSTPVRVLRTSPEREFLIMHASIPYAAVTGGLRRLGLTPTEVYRLALALDLYESDGDGMRLHCSLVAESAAGDLNHPEIAAQIAAR
jgi:hypothetical protein